ncbi:uncharacterized protein LOC120170452 isoform X1 [Hibiscus syriacus]|uniref:uncharacterized protein LOC120170452 isoform X1 n=1 Tax=Hibiscus syriacus TaxID=106335 RepID=UPI00192427E7|nr:uncharacterized protein LOC120170452 isoform X1 [Hibiscus syriacus]
MGSGPLSATMLSSVGILRSAKSPDVGILMTTFFKTAMLPPPNEIEESEAVGKWFGVLYTNGKLIRNYLFEFAFNCAAGKCQNLFCSVLLIIWELESGLWVENDCPWNSMSKTFKKINALCW